MNSEQWRGVPGLPDYQVSDAGNVRRATDGLHYAAGDHLRQVLVAGYRAVSLSSNGKKRLHKVHRLVLLAFVGEPPPGKNYCAHNDGDRLNNRLENLRWDSCKGNLADRARHGTEIRGQRNGRAKLTPEQVTEIRRVYTPRDPLSGAAALARRYGVTDVAIIKAARGDNWSHLPA